MMEVGQAFQTLDQCFRSWNRDSWNLLNMVNRSRPVSF